MTTAYVLVNMAHYHGPTLCDEKGEVYFDFKDAKKERDHLRKEFDNPGIHIFNIDTEKPNTP